MDLRKLARYSNRIDSIMHGKLDWEMNQGLEALEENEDWELMSVLMLTASELPARRMAERMVEHGRYFDLVLPACFRRQIKKAEIIDQGRLTRSIFRDIDALDSNEQGGIPDHIREMGDEISEGASRLRFGALSRGLAEDNDAIRDFIVENLGESVLKSADCVNALVLVACCAMFEDTRRLAALKIANSEPTVRKLAAAGRAGELVQISMASEMESVATNIARALTDLMPQLIEKGNRRVLRFMAENHPDEEIRTQAYNELPPQ